LEPFGPLLLVELFGQEQKDRNKDDAAFNQDSDPADSIPWSLVGRIGNKEKQWKKSWNKCATLNIEM
jgi:hypothetical protein